jgi:hypothetical protein
MGAPFVPFIAQIAGKRKHEVQRTHGAGARYRCSMATVWRHLAQPGEHAASACLTRDRPPGRLICHEERLARLATLAGGNPSSTHMLETATVPPYPHGDKLGIERDRGWTACGGNRRYHPCAVSRPDCRRPSDAKCFHQEIAVTMVHHRVTTWGVAPKRIGVPQHHHGSIEQPPTAVFISMPHRRLLGMVFSRALKQNLRSPRRNN